MKCHIMWHFIWVFTVCQSTCLGVSGLLRVKGKSNNQKWHAITVNVLKFQTLFFLCSDKMLVIRAGYHKMLVRIANREDTDRQSDLDLHCLSWPFCPAPSA